MKACLQSTTRVLLQRKPLMYFKRQQNEKSKQLSIVFHLTKPNQPIIQNQSFQDHYICLKGKLFPHSQVYHTFLCDHWQKSVLSRSPQHPNVKMIQNQLFQDLHSLLKCIWPKISPFKDTPSQSENYPNKVLSRPLHPPKVTTVESKSFQDHNTLTK